MKIAVDCDGVLADFARAVNRLANKLWPGRLADDYEPTSWRYKDVFSPKEWSEVWVHIRATTNFWLTVPPFLANLRAFEKFLGVAIDTDVYLLTSRTRTAGGTSAWQTARWLDSLGFYTHIRNYVGITVVPSWRVKAGIIALLGIDYFIDDHPETVRQCAAIPGHKAFLHARPHNAKQRDGLSVVYSLEEFFSHVR